MRTGHRGFIGITVSLYDDFQKNRPIEKLCELGGLGTFKKPKAWKDSSSGEFKEVIIDNVSLHIDNHYQYTPDVIDAESVGATVIVVNDAYSEESKSKALEEIAPYKFDILLDDAASVWPDMANSLKIYKDIIVDDGLYITETPDGNGDSMYDFHYSDPKRISRHALLSSYGMVIFDMSKYSHYDTLEEEVGMGGNQIGIYSPRFDIFKNTINKYKEHIIAGREWVEHLID